MSKKNEINRAPAAKKNQKQIPANVEAMIASLDGVERWLDRDKNRQALVFLSDGKNYTFVLVNSNDVMANIAYPMMDDPHAMCRFLGIAESAECCQDFLLEDAEYKQLYERIWKKECCGVDPEKDQIRSFGIIPQNDDEPCE